MDWTTLLFSFRGRINRGKYWLAILIYTLIWGAFVAAIFMWMGRVDNFFSLAGVGLLVWLGFVVLLIAGAWSGLATGIKRLHDRDKSGWWILLFWFGPSLLSGSTSAMPDMQGGFLVGLAGTVIATWGIVEIGFMRGTTGPNAYGPDPLEPPLAPART